MLDLGPLRLDDVVSAWGLLVLAVGVCLALGVASKPQLLWPALIVVNLVGLGPKLLGYVLIDEILSAFIVAGAVARVAVRRSPQRRIRRLPGRERVFLIWLAYMILQSGVGAVINDDSRIMRWVLFYGLLGALTLLLHHRGAEHPFPSARSVALITTVTAILYCIAYLAQGVAVEAIYGPAERFSDQDYLWAGSSAAVLPSVVFLPGAIYLLRSSALLVRAAAWFCVGLLVAVAVYYDSRAAWFTLLAMFAVSWRRVGLPRFAVASAVIVTVAYVSAGRDVNALSHRYDDLVQTATVWAPRESDTRSRLLQVRAGVDAALSDWRVFVFGAGVYSHRSLIVPHVRSLLTEFPQWADFTSIVMGSDGPVEIVRTVGFSALLIDTGIIGFGLFSVIFAGTLRAVWRVGTVMRTTLLTAIGLMLLWIFATNVLDAIMLFLFVMPGGIAERWNEAARRIVVAPERSSVPARVPTVNQASAW